MTTCALFVCNFSFSCISTNGKINQKDHCPKFHSCRVTVWVPPDFNESRRWLRNIANPILSTLETLMIFLTIFYKFLLLTTPRKKYKCFSLFYYLKILWNDRDRIFKGFYSDPRFHALAIFLRNFESKNLYQSNSSTKVII